MSKTWAEYAKYKEEESQFFPEAHKLSRKLALRGIKMVRERLNQAGNRLAHRLTRIIMTFQDVQKFLKSWGLDPTTESNIPYPEVYTRMCNEAYEVGGDKLEAYISSITDTTDSQTYIALETWLACEQYWLDMGLYSNPSNDREIR